MDISLESLCRKVEIAEPTAKAIPIPESNQIIVTFSNRPGVEIALLTPWQQKLRTEGKMELVDILDLTTSVRKIAIGSID